MVTDIILTILTMAFAFMVVFSRKTVVAAFALLMTLLCIGMIYFQLGAVFLAAIQVLINAGAIAILFVFVMMLINLEQFQDNYEKGKWKLMASAVTIIVLLSSFFWVINSNIDMLSEMNLTDNSMKLLFDKLFTEYFLPFEMATVLLLAALVATIVITDHERPAKLEEENAHE